MCCNLSIHGQYKTTAVGGGSGRQPPVRLGKKSRRMSGKRRERKKQRRAKTGTMGNFIPLTAHTSGVIAMPCKN